MVTKQSKGNSVSHTVRTDRQAGRQDDDNVMRKENMQQAKMFSVISYCLC